ncbi:MAG: hypothetical protein M0Z33_09945 [Actinomycetota bacterium]|nr:hypothetical protein [Actinomycetota bacterium]
MDASREDLEKALAEAAYAAVGFAILGVQRAQVARRAVERLPPVRAAVSAASRVVSEARDALLRSPGP